MIITDLSDIDNAATTETSPIARQIYNPRLIMPLPGSMPSSTTTTFITIFTITTITIPSQQPTGTPQPTTHFSEPPKFTHFSFKVHPTPATISRATVSFQRPGRPFSSEPSPTPLQLSQPTPDRTSFQTATPVITSTPSSPISISPVASSRPPVSINTSKSSLPPSVLTSFPSPPAPTSKTSSTSSPLSVTGTTITLDTTGKFELSHSTHSVQKLSSSSPASTIIVAEPSLTVFHSTTSEATSSSPPKFLQFTSHINHVTSKIRTTPDLRQMATSSHVMTLNSTFLTPSSVHNSQPPASPSRAIMPGITPSIFSTSIPTQNFNTPVSASPTSIITTPNRTMSRSSSIAPSASDSSTQSASAVSVSSRTSHEPSTTRPATSQNRSIMSSGTSVPLDVPSPSTRILGTSGKGFLRNPGAMAGTFIAVGLCLIAGIIFIVLMCKRRRAGHKYRKLTHGVMDENEVARLTAPVSVGSQTNLSMTTSEYQTSYQFGSSRDLLEQEMDEITPRPSLANRPHHPTNFALTVPETAMSGLVTLPSPTVSNVDGSPVDPIDPFGPHRYSIVPDPFRTPRASVIDPYLLNSDAEAARKWTATNEIPAEMDLVQPANNDNNVLPEPYVREGDVALPAKKTSTMSWLDVSSERTESV